MKLTNLPFFLVNSMAGFNAAWDHARTVPQIRLMADLHNHLTTLFKLPQDQYDRRIHLGFTSLLLIVTGLELDDLGAMRENFVRKLFSMGEQIVRYLEAAINLRHGAGELMDFARFRERFETYGGKRTTSQKEQRHLRHSVVVASAQTAFALPVECARRIHEACDAVQLCAGDPRLVCVQHAGVWRLPQTSRKDKRWETEMQFYALKSLQAAAQCLGHRFMRWPVEIRGQVVPGTGVKYGAVLEDWEAIHEDEL